MLEGVAYRCGKGGCCSGSVKPVKFSGPGVSRVAAPSLSGLT